MKGLFLDPLKPLSTCATAACDGCPLQSRLQCHFGGRELLRFFGIALPPFILGGIGIAQVNAWLLLPWIGVAVAYFGFVEIRVMCSHCPHYAEPGSKSLQCWANYGSPKLWKYRPGPMTRNEKLVFFAGLVVIAGYPLAFLISSAQWLLLALLGITVACNAAIMKRLMCARCINLACPFNGVDQTTQASFFTCNPVVAQGWQNEGKN